MYETEPFSFQTSRVGLREFVDLCGNLIEIELVSTVEFYASLECLQPQLNQGIRRRDGLGDYLYANQICQV